MRITGSLGMLLLGILLILAGATPLLHLRVSSLPILMAILSIIAGILIIVGR
jgi:hypothetical protein